MQMWFVIISNKFIHFHKHSMLKLCSQIQISDEIPKLLKVHNEVLSLLTGKQNDLNIVNSDLLFTYFSELFFFSPLNTEMKKKNNEIHKSVMLELQICRQDIIEEVQQLRQSFTRMTDLLRRNSNNNQNLGILEYMDDDNETEEASDSETSQDEDFLDDFLR